MASFRHTSAVPPSALIDALDRTVSQRWRTRFLRGAAERGHWQTKVGYYRVVTSLVAGGATNPTWSAIVGHHPRGSRSTFYAVAGPHARHSLLAEYRHAGDPWLVELADLYGLTAPEHLTCETAVWAFWSRREAWAGELARLTVLNPDRVADSLALILADWWRRSPGMAALGHGLPPICVLEDCHLLSTGRESPGELAQVLRERLTDLRDPLEDGLVTAADQVQSWHCGPPSPGDLVADLAAWLEDAELASKADGARAHRGGRELIVDLIGDANDLFTADVVG